MIELSPRLKTIADLACCESVPVSACDVGTDHGYIPVYLAQKGCKRLIATDISAPSAQKAADNAIKYQLGECISVRVGNGLETVSANETECVIIAGMGGLMITKILSAPLPDGIKRFVLQPMRSDYELRLFLSNNGFKIDKEVLCEDDGKIYTVMLVSYGNADYDEFSLRYGKFEETPLYYKYIEQKINSLTKQIKGIKKGGETPDHSLLERYDILSQIKERG